MICSKKNQEIRAKIFRTFFSMQCPVCQAKVIPVRLELSWVCCGGSDALLLLLRPPCGGQEVVFSYLPRPSAARAPRQISFIGEWRRHLPLSFPPNASNLKTSRRRHRLVEARDEATRIEDSFCHHLHFQVGRRSDLK